MSHLDKIYNITKFFNDEEINFGTFQINILISDSEYRKYTVYYRDSKYIPSNHARTVTRQEFVKYGNIIIEMIHNEEIRKVVAKFPELEDDHVLIPYIMEIFNHVFTSEYILKYYIKLDTVHWYDASGFLSTTITL